MDEGGPETTKATMAAKALDSLVKNLGSLLMCKQHSRYYQPSSLERMAPLRSWSLVMATGNDSLPEALAAAAVASSAMASALNTLAADLLRLETSCSSAFFSAPSSLHKQGGDAL